MPDLNSVYDKLQAEQDSYTTKEQIDEDLERAAERKAATDAHRSELAGQEVTFAKAIAAEHKSHEHDPLATENGRTADDITRDLELAAERKRKIDEEKARKAGMDYKHVMEVVEQKKKSVEALQSEREKLDAELEQMSAKQRELEQRMADSTPVL